MSLRLTLALQGDLRAHMRAEAQAAATAIRAGVRQATEGLKDELRQQAAQAGLGQGIANAWRANHFPDTPAGFVYSRAPNVHSAFDAGVTIRSAGGLWLAIPTESAPRRGVGGKRISPSTFPEHAYGPLRFVYRPGRPALLVVDGLRASRGRRGGFRRASARALARGETATVVMFILVPQVTLRKRLDIDRARQRWQEALPRLVLEAWPQPAARAV